MIQTTHIAEIKKIDQLIQHETAQHPSWIEIDKKAILHNLEQYRAIVYPAHLAPVVKSNAYGHGIGLIAAICEESPMVDMLCCVTVSEAVYLRSIGIKKPLLVLSIVLDSLEQAIVHDVDLAVCDFAIAITLQEIAKKCGKKVNIHIKIDTGLSRLGFLAEEAFETIQHIYKLSHITIKGIFTHFADSESSDQSFTNFQINRFETLIARLEDVGISIPIHHTSCSAAITSNMQSHFSMTRLGIGLYGLWPSPGNKVLTSGNFPSFSLQPALTWKTRIMHLKQIPAGSFVGYDRTHELLNAATIATLPIGYWDGYDRSLSNKGTVYINGQAAPVVGRVAMNLTMIDVTNLNVSIGDEVVLMGNYPGATAEAIARHCGTINYEVVTRINPLLPRIVAQ